MTSPRRFMLDTDTVSFALRGEGGVDNRLRSHGPAEICMSGISLAKLRFGADRRRSKRIHALIDKIVLGIEIVPFDADAAAMFGRLASALTARGTPIGQLDTLIAAHAMSLNLTLVTNNTKHFKQVHGLKLANWYGAAG